MAVSFNSIPTNLRVPLFYAEVNAGDGYFAGNSLLLMVGQKTADGSAAANIPILVDKDPNELFGPGSMLADMVVTARKNSPFAEIWAVPLADTGVAAEGAITVDSAGVAGVLTLYIAGREINVTTTSADTVTTVGGKIAAAINAGYVRDGRPMSFPVTAEASAGVVTLTAANAGALGNSISISKDLVGDEGPLASTVTITAMTGGSGVPTLTTALANLSDKEFDFIAQPYTDSTSLNAFRDLMSDTSGRWSPMLQLYGHVFTAYLGNLSAQVSLGSGRNDQHMSIMGVAVSPTPVWEWAAAVAAKTHRHKNLGIPVGSAVEISRPMHSIILEGVLASRYKSDHWDRTERQSLYYNGISGFHVRNDGQVAIDRLLTTYRENAWGQADPTWLDVETPIQMAYIVRYLRTFITGRHARKALANDNPRGLLGLTTPGEIKADICHAYRLLADGGIAENPALFASSVIVERNDDPTRVDVYLPVDVVNQLRVFAVNATTYLQRT